MGIYFYVLTTHRPEIIEQEVRILSIQTQIVKSWKWFSAGWIHTRIMRRVWPYKGTPGVKASQRTFQIHS